MILQMGKDDYGDGRMPIQLGESHARGLDNGTVGSKRQKTGRVRGQGSEGGPW